LKTASYDTHSGFGLRGGVGRDDRLCPCQRAFRGRDPSRRADHLALIDPAKGAAAPPPRTNRHLYTDDRSARPDPLCREGVALPDDRRRRPRARPRVVQVSVGLSGSWSVVEIVRADGFVATDVGRWCGSTSRSWSNRMGGARRAASASAALSTTICSRETWQRGIDVALNQALVNLDSVAAPAAR
jgi:TldD protein